MRNTFDNKEEKPFQIDWEQALGSACSFLIFSQKKSVFYLVIPIFFRTFASRNK